MLQIIKVMKLTQLRGSSSQNNMDIRTLTLCKADKELTPYSSGPNQAQREKRLGIKPDIYHVPGITPSM